ncbi:hypothetical protein OIU35_12675 [Boseaceae bacterium BT-24-1]|nr:hypothetical protein [Boseaceae bacterium BT-24-1]
MNREGRSKNWKIKEHGSISAGFGLAGGHFVFKMTAPGATSPFTVRFTGGGVGGGGGLSVDPQSFFASLGWNDINPLISFCMDDLHGAKGTLKIASAALGAALEYIAISAWKGTSSAGYRQGILFLDTVISGIEPDTPKLPKAKPKVKAKLKASLQIAALTGVWSVDR